MRLSAPDGPKESQESDFTLWIYLDHAFPRYFHTNSSEHWIIAHSKNSTIATYTGGYYDSYTVTGACHFAPREDLTITCRLHTDAGGLSDCSGEFSSLHAVQIGSQHRRYDRPVIMQGVVARWELSTKMACLPASPNDLAQLEISKKSANLGPAANPHASSPGSDSATSVAKSADFQASIVDHFQKGADGEDLSNSFSQNLKALVPENVSSSHANLPMTVSQHPSSAAVNFLNLSLFMLSNKFLGPDSDISTKVYHWIKRRSDVGLLEYLLSIGGPTAEALAEQLFSLAIEEDDARTVKKILDSGLDCKELRCSSTRWSTTPLQRACQLRSLEVVRVLLNAGADVNSSPSGPYSPLSCAVNTDQYGQIDSVDIELVQVLLRAGAKVNPSPNESPLLQAAANCHVELVTVLLSAGADPKFSVEDCGDTPLICAVASEGSISDIVSIVRHLLKAGADVHAATDYDNEVLTVLQHALYQSNVGLIQVLLEGGAHITESTLIDAVNARKSNIVKLFLSSGARVTQKVIEVAASNAESEIFWLLLDSVDDGTKESSRSGALTQAICYGKKDLIDALSASGVKLRSTSQLTAAIEAAAARGDISVLRLLLNDDSTYRASAVKSLGCSLSRAIANGRSDITEMLDSHVVWDPLAVDDGNIDDQWFGDWMHMG